MNTEQNEQNISDLTFSSTEYVKSPSSYRTKTRRCHLCIEHTTPKITKVTISIITVVPSSNF